MESLAEELLSSAASSTSTVIQDLMQTLQDQCGIVSRILNDVLSLQKMEDGRFTLEMMPFSPAQLIRQTVDSFKASFQSRHQIVTVRIQSLDAYLGCVEFDSEDLYGPTGALKVPAACSYGHASGGTTGISPAANLRLEDRALSSQAMLIGGNILMAPYRVVCAMLMCCHVSWSRLLPAASSAEQLSFEWCVLFSQTSNFAAMSKCVVVLPALKFTPDGGPIEIALSFDGTGWYFVCRQFKSRLQQH